MRIHTLQNLISSLLEPTRVFIAILLAVTLWLLPAVIQPPINNTEKIRQPLQEAGGITLVSAIQANAPNCARECQYDECVNWKPGPSPICPRPGPGGGCCLAYETRCDPGCEDPTPPTLPPTISAVLNCSQYGNNGWCIGDLTLNLTASDPQGQSVTISGAVNGASFPCTAGATTCSTSVLSEGARTITYRVDSATGLSAAGSTNYKLDTSLPSIGGNLNGVTGINGWYRSNVSLDVLASDLGSGIASVTASIDGGAVSAVSGPITFTDGIHSIEITVTDYAGFVNQASQIIQVDTITPTLSTSVSGTSGLNGWYVSNVAITPSSGDAGSGLLALEVNADGGGYIPYTSPIVFTDGIHTYQFRAMDIAGNITETAQQTIQVDTITPSLSTSISGTSGSNGWYVSNVTITPSVSDSGSGLSAFVVSTDGSAYSTYINPVFFTEGVHTYRFRATDYAGNITEISQQTIRVDTTTPTISLTITGTLGTNGWYISNVTVATQVSDATSTVGSVEAAADGGAWSVASQLSLSDGLHTYQFRVIDQAGNTTTVPLQNIKIDTIVPFIDMTATLSLGETVYYEFQDNGSGLSFYRTVIEDDDERYQKVTWLDTLSGNKFKEDVLWDGKFADGTKAGWGEYFITLKVTDAAGNKAIKAAVVTVNPFSFLQDIPAFTPPQSAVVPVTGPDTGSTPSTTTLAGGFGGENNNTNAGATVTTNEGGQSNPPSDGTTTTSITGNTPNPFADGAVLAGVGSASNHAGQTQPGNLLGTLGLVAAGTLAYETYRRRQEDEQQSLSSNNINPVVSSGGVLASPVRIDPPPPVEPTPPIDDDGDDDDKKDIVVTATPNPYVPIPMPVPIAPGTPVISAPRPIPSNRERNPVLDATATTLGEAGSVGAIYEADRYLAAQRATEDGRHTATMWGEGVYHANNGEWNWDRVNAKIEDYQARTDLKIGQLAEEAAQTKKSTWLGELGMQWDSTVGTAKMKLDALWNNGLPSLKKPAALDLNDFSGNTGDAMAVAGSLGYAMTGDQIYKRTADAGQVLGISGGVANIVKYGNAAMEALPTVAQNITQIGKGITFLGKASGILSGLVGVYSMYTGVNKINEARSQGNTQMQWAGGLEFASGALATAGGIAMFIPGAQPVAAVLLGASAIASGASMAVENWPAIRTAAKQSASILSYYAGEGVAGLGNFFSATSKNIGNVLGNAVNSTGSFFSNVTRATGNAIGNAVTATGNLFSNVTRVTGDAIGNAVNAAGNFFSNTTRAVSNTVGSAVTGTFNVVGNAVRQIGSTSSNPAVRAVTNTVANAVSGTGSAISSGVRNLGNGIADFQKTVGQNVGNTIKNMSNAVANTQKNTGQVVGNLIKNVSDVVANTQRATGQAVGNTVKNIGSAVATAQKSAGQAVASGLKKLAGWFAKP